MIISKPIYSGPAKGLYERERFDQFMEALKTAKRNGDEERSLEVNKEKTGLLTTMYHLPTLGVGVQYRLLRFSSSFVTEIRLVAHESNKANVSRIEKIILKAAITRPT